MDSSVQIAHARLSRIAAEILGGRTTISDGARAILAVRSEAHELPDELFDSFVAFESETDHLPFGPVRELWDPTQLARVDAERVGYEEHYRPRIERACRDLLVRFARFGA